MSERKKFDYKHSEVSCFGRELKQPSTGSLNGLKWTWSIHTEISSGETPKRLHDYKYFTWNFEWKELKKTGIVGFKGFISTLYKNNKSVWIPGISELELTKPRSKVERRVCADNIINNNNYYSFEFTLKPIMVTPEPLKFPLSELTDAILVVDGVKIHVNRALLSAHSDYFRVMFNSDFKEKAMQEIPIEDIKYKDFALLLAVIQLEIVFSEDEDFESLLKLADRFNVPSVFHRVQHHLMTVSQLPFMKIMMLADKYNLEKAVAHCISLITSGSELKSIKLSPIFPNLSTPTKLQLLDVVGKVSKRYF